MTGTINANETLNGGVEAIPTLSGTLSGNTTSSYNSLSDKPIINGTTLEGGVDRSLVEDVKVNGVSVVNEEHIAEIEFSAENVPYDNTDSQAQSTDVQGALDEAFQRTLDIGTWFTDVVAERYNYIKHYTVGDYVFNFPSSGVIKLYRCISDTSGVWDSTKWEEVKLSNEVSDEVTLREELESATKVYGTPKNLPQPIATFTDGANLPMPSLKVSIEPIQSGSGDPSPTNIRPISGWTEANVTVADDVETPTVSNVYTIDLDGTRYGGTLDVVSGVLTVDRVSLTVDENSNIISGSGGLPFRIDLLTGAKASSSASALTGVKCNFLKEVKQSSSWGVDGTFSRVTTDAKIVYFKVNSEITTIQQLKTFLQSNNLQFVYELATPITIQLSPTSIKSLEGSNNVWGDCGNIKDLKYVRNLNITINDLISRVEALEG